MLHLIRHSPSVSTQLARCLDYIQPEDTLLLLADAVLALQQSCWCTRLQQSGASIYALQADLDARGICTRAATVIDYRQWVNLVVMQGNPCCW